MATSPTQTLATLTLGTDVVQWARVRAADPDRSFQSIARELREATGGVVDVTDETIRRWCSTQDAA